MKATSLTKLLIAAAISGASFGAHAATYSYSGTITSCSGVCSIFTAVGQSANFGFEAIPMAGTIDSGDISNVDISLSTPSGGSLAFVAGTSLGSTLTTDGLDNITGGTVTLQATGATTGIVAQAVLDVPSGTWTAFVVPTSGPLEQIASGTGAFAPISEIPVPAAAWLFGSALLGLSATRRRCK